jgi:hypothetical protein
LAFADVSDCLLVDKFNSYLVEESCATDMLDSGQAYKNDKACTIALNFVHVSVLIEHESFFYPLVLSLVLVRGERTPPE